jgi:tetratricopeptide (TPR) repeat protein
VRAHDEREDGAAQPAPVGGGEPAILDAYRLWQRGGTAEAEALCHRILAGSPGDPGALHLLACIARAAGAGGRALDLLRRACASPGAPAFLQDERAQLCQEQGLLAEAEEAGRRSVEIQPMRAQAWHHLAITLVMAGKLDAAREALAQAVVLDPASSAARNNLAIVLQRLGLPEDARAQYEAALGLAPDDAELHSNLAAVLAALGRHEEGLEAARRAVALNPGLIGAHLHVALIEMELGRLDAALSSTDAILPAAPDNVEMLLLRADILGRLDRPDEALALCQRALALRPTDGNAFNLLGLQFQTLTRDEEALAAFARAAVLLPQPGIPLANQGALLGQLGRAEEAEVVLGRALALEPDCAAVWYTRALIGRRTADDPDRAAMEAILRENRALAHNERLCLHFALGGIYLDAGDGERAFAHLAQGARMKRALISYDGPATERWMSEIAAAFPATLFADDRRRALATERPVFVVGMPRSGTTLIEQILGSHPRIHAAGELRSLGRAVARALSSRDPRAFPGAFAPERCEEIARDYLAQLAAVSPDADRVVDKMTSNFVYAGLIHLMLPRARIILCRRDPADTCLSCYSKLFTRGQEFSYDLVELAGYFQAQDALAAHWRKVLPPQSFLEVDYESVVGDVEAAARRLVAFCGLPWSPDCLAFHEARRPIRTASMIQVRQPIYSSSVGRWRQFRAQLAPLLEVLGT